MTVYVAEVGDCHLPHDGLHHPHHVYDFPRDRLAPGETPRPICLKCGQTITYIKEY